MTNTLLSKIQFHRMVSLQTGYYGSYIETETRDILRITRHIYHSLHIEGNTVDEQDTLNIIKGVVPITEAYDKYSKNEVNEIIGMAYAVKLFHAGLETKVLTEQFIKELHFALYHPVEKPELGIYAGEYKTYENYVIRSDGTKRIFTPPQEIEQAMADLVFLYNSSNHSLQDICRLKLNFIFHHPFGDGNGRISRLLLNWALITSGFLPVLIPCDEKTEYVNILNDFGETSDIAPFVTFIGNKILTTYKGR